MCGFLGVSGQDFTVYKKCDNRKYVSLKKQSGSKFFLAVSGEHWTSLSFPPAIALVLLAHGTPLILFY